MTTHAVALDYSFVTKYLPEETAPISAPTNVTGAVPFSYALTATAQETVSETIPAKPFTLDLTPNQAGQTILPGSAVFTWGGNRYFDRLGKLYRNPSPLTGLAAEAGTIDYLTGIASLSVYDGGDNTVVLNSLSARIGKQLTSSVVFRAPGAPVRPGSINISGTTLDGRQISGVSNFDGTITGSMVRGDVDYEKGTVVLEFGEMVADDAGFTSEAWYDADAVVGGQIFKPAPAFADTLSYSCVVYSYIPLDADLIGLDPVRLPSDGRVPIVKTGDVVVIHNTQTEQLPNPVSPGQVVTLNRAGIASVEVYDSSALPLRVESTKYSFDADSQELTFEDPLDLSGFTQPLVAMHRVEDMSLISGVQINGQLTIASGLANDYPVAGTYVSTALLFGDLQARAYNVFDQKTWTSEWSDDLIGDATAANYNEINYPFIVTNAGAVRERWALVFDAADHFDVIGEKYGIVHSGYITNDCNPINPSTGQPFFFIDFRGWGNGWATGNVVRFNTEGANNDLWIARTTLQGPATEPSDQFTLQIRGDAE